jgi:hypothetical protein
MTLANDLRTVRKLIETPDKWVRLHNTKKIGVYSLYSAIIQGSRDTHKTIGLIVQFIECKNRLDHPVRKIAAYSRAKTTTHADIIALLDKVIAAAEKEEKNE